MKFGPVVFPICDYERSDLQTLLGSAGPSLQLGTETVAASDQVRVVGVTLTSVGPVSRQARCHARLCDVLLLASPTQTGPTFTGR